MHPSFLLFSFVCNNTEKRVRWTLYLFFLLFLALYDVPHEKHMCAVSLFFFLFFFCEEAPEWQGFFFFSFACFSVTYGFSRLFRWRRERII